MEVHRQKVNGKNVQLMATCLCDAFFDDVARAAVEVLEYAGCNVRFPEDQTCCGQPAFNSGDWEAARRVVRHAVRVFPGPDPVVIPSASCASMIFHGALLGFEKEADRPQVEELASRTWELTDFLVNGLGIKKWPGKFQGKVALHRSCHSRGSNTIASILSLLSTIEGLELVPFGETEQCCGFGGTFSVTFPNISSAMGHLKLDNVAAAKPDLLTSPDMGCLFHLGGIADKEGRTVRRLHVGQILRDSLRNAGILAPV